MCRSRRGGGGGGGLERNTAGHFGAENVTIKVEPPELYRRVRLDCTVLARNYTCARDPPLPLKRQNNCGTWTDEVQVETLPLPAFRHLYAGELMTYALSLKNQAVIIEFCIAEGES